MPSEEILHLNAKFPSDISGQRWAQLCYYRVIKSSLRCILDLKSLLEATGYGAVPLITSAYADSAGASSLCRFKLS